jgi:hypothetical protein
MRMHLNATIKGTGPDSHDTPTRSPRAYHVICWPYSTPRNSTILHVCGEDGYRTTHVGVLPHPLIKVCQCTNSNDPIAKSDPQFPQAQKFLHPRREDAAAVGGYHQEGWEHRWWVVTLRYTALVELCEVRRMPHRPAWWEIEASEAFTGLLGAGYQVKSSPD